MSKVGGHPYIYNQWFYDWSTSNSWSAYPGRGEYFDGQLSFSLSLSLSYIKEDAPVV